MTRKRHRSSEKQQQLATPTKASEPRGRWKTGVFAVAIFLLVLVVGGVSYQMGKMPPQPQPSPLPSRSEKPSEKREEGSGEEFVPSILKGLKMSNVVEDDRHFKYEALPLQTKRKSNAKVYIIENFLSDIECDALIRLHHKHSSDKSIPSPLFCFDSVQTLQVHLNEAEIKYHATNADFTAGTYCLNASFSERIKPIIKWSSSTAFYPGELRFTNILDERIYKTTGLKPENGGKYQLTSYAKEIGYKMHTDCTLGPEKRDRYATILVYLRDVERGGETVFPELGISVRPVKGRALVWNSMDSEGNCDPTTIHKAKRVESGHKIILQRWYYYMNFPALGRRPPPPPNHLPPRLPNQPLVQCDTTDSGSCRWYDEWGYIHIRDYRHLADTGKI